MKKITKTQIKHAKSLLKEFRCYETEEWTNGEDLPFMQLYTESVMDKDGNLQYTIWLYNNNDGEGLTEEKEVERLGDFLIGRRGEDLSWKLNKSS